MSSQTTVVVHCGLTLGVSFESYRVFAHLHIRNEQTKCHHITYNDSRDNSNNAVYLGR